MRGVGSDIPKARKLINQIIEDLDELTDSWVQDALKEALALMTRKKATRVATYKKIPITPIMKKEIRRLARTTDASLAEISIAVGLGPRGQGRVSEILDGLR